MYAKARSGESRGVSRMDGRTPGAATGGWADGLRVRLLGGFSASCDGQTLLDESFRHGKAKAIIKLLAIQPGRTLHREQVLTTLWGHLTPRAAAANLRKHLHYVRAALRDHGRLPELISTSRESLGLTPVATLDIDEFRALARRARERRTDATLYERALALYTGDLLPEDCYEDWASDAREELLGLRAGLLEDLAQLYLTLGRLDAAHERLAELVTLDPLDEERQRALARVLAQQGDRQGALRQLDQARELLRTELGAEPEPETEALRREILEQQPVRAHGSPAPANAFIGRERELAELRSAMDDAIAGRTRVVLIAGEPGIGKTRLTEEMATYARIQGASVAWGPCHEDGAAPAYWPWVQIVRESAGRSRELDFRGFEGSGRDARSGFFRESSDGEAARFRLYESFASFTRTLTSERPALFVLEDIHWADGATLRLLQYLARGTRDARALIVATYRGSEITEEHPLEELLPDLDQLPNVTLLSLRGLTQGETGALIEAVTSTEPSAAMVSHVYEQTAGNPFFVTQVLRLLQAQGIDASEQGVTRLPVPDTVRHVIARRLEDLSVETDRALTMAAVIGRDFTLGTLEATTELSGEQLLVVMDEARAAGLVLEDEGTVARFSFVHALVRETIYENIPLSKRVALHREVGDTLEHVYQADLGPHYDELAHHFSHAAAGGPVETEKAIDYSTRAGLRAKEAYAHEESVGHFRRALELLDASSTYDPQRRHYLQIQIGWAERRTGNTAEAKEHYRQAFETGREISSPDAQAYAAFSYGLTGFRSGVVDGLYVSMLKESLEALGPEDHALGALLRCLLARTLYWSDQLELCSELAQEGVAMARRVGDQHALADCLWFSFLGTWSPDTLAQRFELGDDLLSIGRANGIKAAENEGHVILAIAQLESGDVISCERHLDASGRIGDELKDPYNQVEAAQGRTALAILQARLDEGERLAQRVLELNQRVGASDAAAIFGVQLALIRWEQGRLDEIEQFAKNFVDEYPTIPSWRAALAWIYREQGKEVEARREFEVIAQTGFTSVRKENSYLLAIALLSDVAAYLQDRPRIERLYEMLRPYRNRNVVVTYAIGCAGPTSLYLGELATALERWDEAGEFFAEAEEMAKRLGSPSFQNRTKVEHARMLLARRGTGDEEAARSLLEDAVADAKAIGQLGLVSKAEALVDESDIRYEATRTRG